MNICDAFIFHYEQSNKLGESLNKQSKRVLASNTLCPFQMMFSSLNETVIHSFIHSDSFTDIKWPRISYPDSISSRYCFHIKDGEIPRSRTIYFTAIMDSS